MKAFALGLYRDSLFRNSFNLMLSTGILGALGFLFWVACSHLFTPQEIGLATSLISAASFMSGLSGLGLNNSIIRFLPGSNTKSTQLSTAFTIVTVASIITSIGFLLWAVATKNPLAAAAPISLLAIVFISFVIVQSVNTLTESAFVAYRATRYILFKNALLSVIKITLPFVIVGSGFVGIFLSFEFATIAATLLSFIVLISKFDYHPRVKIEKEVVREAGRFAAGNYAANLFGMMPSALIPIIILTRLGAHEAAFYYMPLMIITFLNVIPGASSQALFAESAHDESRLAEHLRSSLRHLFIIMLPAALVVIVAGPFVLHFFGADYASAGTKPLFILVAASLVGALNYFGDTLLNIQKRVQNYIAMNALNAIVIVVLTYLTAPYGLGAVALSNLVGQILTLVVYLVINWKLVRAQFSTQSA